MYYYAASCRQGRHVRALWPIPVAAWSSEWPILGVLGRRGRPIRSCASWEPQEFLGVDVTATISRWRRTMHEAETWSGPRLVLRWGVSAGADPNIAEALMYSAETLVYSVEALSGRRIVGTVVGHSGQ